MSTIAPTAFGELLRRHRHTAELTQEALAERAGLSVDGIQKLERGVTHPYRDTVQRLVTALQLAGAGEHAFREAAPAPRQRAPSALPSPPAQPRHQSDALIARALVIGSAQCDSEDTMAPYPWDDHPPRMVSLVASRPWPSDR